MNLLSTRKQKGTTHRGSKKSTLEELITAMYIFGPGDRLKIFEAKFSPQNMPKKREQTRKMSNTLE